MHIKTTMRYHFIAIRMAVTKNEKISIDKCGETGTLGIVGGIVYCCSHYENSTKDPQQIKNRTTMLSSNSTSRNLLKGKKTQ